MFLPTPCDDPEGTRCYHYISDIRQVQHALLLLENVICCLECVSAAPFALLPVSLSIRALAILLSSRCASASQNLNWGLGVAPPLPYSPTGL